MINKYKLYQSFFVFLESFTLNTAVVVTEIGTMKAG